MTKTITILGSTGSIGQNTVRLIAEQPEHYEVLALTAHRNVALLSAQARQLGAKRAVIADESLYNELKKTLSGSGIEAAAGKDALAEAAAMPAEWVMAAIVGAAGLKPTMVAVERGATVALANKECLVCAGELMMQAVKNSGATLIPVDSEHNAIFQVLDTTQPEKIEKIILTASGGPFRTYEKAHMAKVTPREAVAHPNWNMGAKISIDSATMMNKGLELIEAYHLFPVEAAQIEIIIHPESVIHSMVQYSDGSVLAQLGTPDMSTPIAYALGWPERLTTHRPRLDFAQLHTLHFETPDTARFPALTLARKALEAGGSAPIMLNAANEEAVAAFLDGHIGFLDIVAITEQVLGALPASAPKSLEDILAIDQQARLAAEGLIGKKKWAA